MTMHDPISDVLLGGIVNLVNSVLPVVGEIFLSVAETPDGGKIKVLYIGHQVCAYRMVQGLLTGID